MPYEISSRDDGRYLALVWTGAISAPEIEASGIEVIEHAAREGFERLLVDVSRITNRLSLTDLFFSTEANAKLGPPRPRVAVLGRDELADDLAFIENVGVNRGMPLKTFTSEREALAWLLA